MKKIFLVAILLVVLSALFLISLAAKGIFLISNPVFTGKNCENYKTVFLRNTCWGSAAFSRGDWAFCDKMVISPEDETSGINKELCYSNVARKTKDITLCNKAGSQRNYCIEEYARFYKDKNICRLLSTLQLIEECEQKID